MCGGGGGLHKNAHREPVHVKQSMRSLSEKTWKQNGDHGHAALQGRAKPFACEVGDCAFFQKKSAVL